MIAVDVLSRWIHVGTAIVLVGAVAFLYLVVWPATKNLASDLQEQVRGSILRQWKLSIHVGILLFLVSGFYNYLMVQAPRHKGDGLYHGLVGTKILLALGVMFLLSALVGQSKAFAGIRANTQRWLGITLLLCAVIVGISGYLKVASPGKPPAPPVPVAQLEESALPAR